MKTIIFFIVLLCMLSLPITFYGQVNTNTAQIETQEDDNINDETSISQENEIDTCELRKISEVAWNKIKKDKDFDYTKTIQKKEPTVSNKKPSLDLGKFFNASIFKVILFILVGLILIFIIYKVIADNDWQKLLQTRKKEQPENTDFEQIENFNQWDNALENALKNKDTRLAVRIYYLQTLQILNTKNYIEYTPERTNWEYVSQLFNTPIYHGFKKLTYYFDYVWYGQFPLNNEDYLIIETTFKNFQHEI